MGKITNNLNIAKWYEYAFLIFLMLWSGGGFTYGYWPHWMLYALPIVTLFYFRRGFRIHKEDVWLLITIFSVIFLQMLKFHGEFINTIVPVFTAITCAMTASLFGKKFPIMFVNVLYYLSCICLVLWIITLNPAGLSFLRSLASGLPHLGWDNFESSTNIVDTLYVFNITKDVEGLQHNSGPFWEPGRFTIYITLALAINIFYNKKSLLSKRNLVLIATNITTFSTTGYVAMGVLLMGYVLYSNIKKPYKVSLFVILLCVISFVSQLDFMTDKIQAQSNDIDVTWSRFGAMAYHWAQIVQSPIIGYGPFLNKSTFELASSPNGLTDLIRFFGIPFSAVLYVLLYKGTKLYIGTEKISINIFVFVVILLLCFSQTITYSPFFYLLYFFSLNIKQSYE